ncbi:H1, hypothetical protein [Tieghemostelium lacteum]|uniref:H15 domain-containing protein n=1 Tax=Tieghemostelium lacteum TaxID=361077 RepID=A0A151ZSH2_TIELA|nr:H1, hypothetical protein [Tieghemostelium lacteum]|eukprot:KYQ96892.1 H1, hypothetical protein [Tieghemostelium lacteum]
MSTKKKTASKPKKSTNHPPYFNMIGSAIVHYGERFGSSVIAIQKFMESNYDLDIETYKIHFKTQIKRLVAEGKLEKIKQSYKLSQKGRNEIKKLIPTLAGPKKKAAGSASTDDESSDDQAPPPPKKPVKKAPAKKPAAAPKKKSAASKKNVSKPPAKKPAAKKPAAKK